MDGDDDLELATLKNVAEMKAYASIGNVDVVVLLDMSGKGYGHASESLNTVGN